MISTNVASFWRVKSSTAAFARDSGSFDSKFSTVEVATLSSSIKEFNSARDLTLQFLDFRFLKQIVSFEIYFYSSNKTGEKGSN